MTATARRAYGFARVSVLKAGLRRTGRVAGRGVPFATQSLADVAGAWDELVAVYRTVFRGYPELLAVLDALLARHELRNVLTTLSVLFGQHPRRVARSYWWPLGELASVDEEAAVEATTPAEMAEALDGSRLAALRPLIRDMSYGALGTASLAAERQVWTEVHRAFSALPPSEHQSIALGRLLVLEQDFEWLRRAPAAAGVEPSAAAFATIVLARELPRARLEVLANWSPERGPLSAYLPSRWTWASDAETWDALTIAVRRARRRLCERAFVDRPFALVVPLAVLILKEEEVRALATAFECGDELSPAAIRAQAASLLGS